MKNILSYKVKKISNKNNKIKKKKYTIAINKKTLIRSFVFCLFICLFLNILINWIKNKSDNQQNRTLSFKIEELFFDNISISYRKAQQFITNCIDGISLSKNRTLSEYPKVSAVIPVYNSRKVILRSILSILNQNMTDIELILVEDLSTDNSLSYIEELHKKDPRIKIVKNQKNMGALYSRSLGVLLAKGKYIFTLNNGDMFLDDNVINTIYNIADKDNFDIIEFRAINIDSLDDLPKRRPLDSMFSNHKLNLVLRQPDLGYYPIQPKNETGKFEIIDNYLWNKCIKTEVYQKGLYFYGEDRYKRRMTYYEDLIVIIIVFNVADTYKFIGKYGVLNITNDGNKEQPQEIMNLYEMYLIDTLLIFTKDIKENKKIIVQYMFTLLNRKKIKKTLKNKENKKLFDFLLQRIYFCDMISDGNKKEIKKLTSNLKLRN